MSSSKKPVSLYLTRLTPAIWTQFYSWYVDRGTELGFYPKQIPNHGVWVVSDNVIDAPDGTGKSPELVAGCCLYPADGPFVVVEHVNTNPALPSRLRHAGVDKICWAVAYYGAMVGKTPLCFPLHKGIKRMMQKTGYNFTKPTVQVMYPQPFVPVGTAQIEEKSEQMSSPATMDSDDEDKDDAAE